MKQLSKYLAEKLVINKNYKELDPNEKEYDPEELTTYVLEHFEILPNNQTTKLSRMNKISSDDYNDLYKKLHNLFVDKFDTVHCRNITFLAEARCIGWLDDDLQNSYNESNIAQRIWNDDIKLLKRISDNFAFAIFYVYDESAKTLQVVYNRTLNNITLICNINI